MAANPKKPHRKIRKALLRGERFREKGKIAIRVDSLDLKRTIRKEAYRKATFRKKYGTKKYIMALAISGIVQIVRSLQLPKTRKNRILKLEMEQLKITDYLEELRRKGLKKLSKAEHSEIIELYCDLLKRKINRIWSSDAVKRKQLINELREYEAYLETARKQSYELSEADKQFLVDLVRLTNEEIKYLLEHEQKYYAEARRKLSETLEEFYKSNAL